MPGVDRAAVRLTPEGTYSYTHWTEAKQIIAEVERDLGVDSLKDVRVQDLTANVGGDTIAFAVAGALVRAVELDPDNFSALRHNVELYGLGDRVRLHNGDSVAWWGRFHADVVLIDPKWGGPDYKRHRALDLRLGRTRVDLFLRMMLADPAKRPRLVVLKLPFNYNWARLADLEYRRIKIRNYYIALVKKGGG